MLKTFEIGQTVKIAKEWADNDITHLSLEEITKNIGEKATLQYKRDSVKYPYKVRLLKSGELITVTSIESIDDRVLLGYTLKDEKYRAPAVAALQLHPIDNNDGTFISTAKNIDRAQELGILDLWFTPAYEDYSIKIGEWKAVVTLEGGHVGFGCQHFSKEDLNFINRLLGDEINAKIEIKGVTITPELIERLIAML